MAECQTKKHSLITLAKGEPPRRGHQRRQLDDEEEDALLCRPEHDARVVVHQPRRRHPEEGSFQFSKQRNDVPAAGVFDAGVGDDDGPHPEASVRGKSGRRRRFRFGN